MSNQPSQPSQPSTDLAADALSRAAVVVKKDTYTDKDLAQALVDPADPHRYDVAVVPVAKAPAPVVLTQDAQRALVRLPEVFNSVVLSKDERRTLSQQEIAALFGEVETIDEILSDLTKRKEIVKEYVRLHQDVEAEVNGQAFPSAQRDESGEVVVHATPRLKGDHYLLAGPGAPVRTDVPGTNQTWSNEYREGSVDFDGTRLPDLLEEGEITRQQYLAVTREVRVFDWQKAQMNLRKDSSLLKVLRAITVRKDPTQALNVRKQG